MKRAGHVMVCGVKTPVRVGTVDDQQGLHNAYGCYDTDECVIWLAADCPPHHVPFIATHEGLHAMLNHSGAIRMTSSMLGLDMDNAKDREKMEAWEEALVRVLTPHVVETFGAARVK